MESNATLERASRVIVLHANALDHARRPVVHANRYDDSVLAHRRSQQLVGFVIEPQSVGGPIEPRLCLTERGSLSKCCFRSNDRFHFSRLLKK
jgi:hypothetical protein